MRALAVDAEIYMLEGLKNAVRASSDIERVDAFTSCTAALAHAADNPVDVVINVPVKTTKTVPIKTVTRTSSWRLESEKDIDAYLAQLKSNLMSELEKTDIINVEF